jgi:hypothetical protein
MFSSFFYGRPERPLPSTSTLSVPFTGCVLLIDSSPNACFNIAKVSENVFHTCNKISQQHVAHDNRPFFISQNSPSQRETRSLSQTQHNDIRLKTLTATQQRELAPPSRWRANSKVRKLYGLTPVSSERTAQCDNVHLHSTLYTTLCYGQTMLCTYIRHNVVAKPEVQAATERFRSTRTCAAK